VATTETIAKLREDREFMRDVAEWQRAPMRDARYARFPEQLDASVVASLKRRGIEQLYAHQSTAIESILQGENVVVVASAAGGKSLCFHAPILHSLITEPNARALCLFPTKALSQDQLSNLRSWIDDSLHSSIDNRQSSIVCAYDGDTPQAQRSAIRQNARVLISNFDMLHLGILPHHTRWSSFFKNLRYVVIDEMHTYRGIFGSHVANVIRRLKRICAFYGSRPTFILASATIANPQEHAERLIEARVQLIDNDGSPHGEQHVVLVNPPITDAELGLRRSADFVARDIAARLIDNGLQTICFARSRNSAEVLLTYLREKTGSQLSAMTGQQSVSGYRGGYLPEERREIERGLRGGAIRGVVSTNALELGIDIGELDACVMHGYPGSIASFWQQAGRAGRRRNASISILVATPDPLDQYLVTHPSYLFEQSPEHARIAPDNLGVLASHVSCAAFELPFVRGETLGGAKLDELLDALVEDGDIHASGEKALPLFKADDRQPTNDEGQTTNIGRPSSLTRYTWVGEGYPADRVGLRGTGDRVSIVDDRGNLIGETERGTAAMRVYPGAIYLHQGETWLVGELDWELGKATARRVQSDHYTQPSSVTEVMVLEEFAPTISDSSTDRKSLLGHGEIEVTTTVARYRQIQFNTHLTLGWGEVDLPSQKLLTIGYWFSISAESAKVLDRQGVIALPNDYGPNWDKQRNAARERDGHRCVVCGKPESPIRQHDVHHRKPFRTFGYRRGENENYLQANVLDNLMTVCPTCHTRIETAEPVNRALSGLCYLLGNLAPLFVMCDPSDIAATWDIDSSHTRLPTLTLYEMTPGGTGLTEELLAQHSALLEMAASRIRECPCENGCPSCVGPIDETTAKKNVKQDVLVLIQTLPNF
jgi:DEAD/DEAH box helicase domain-containing protein